MACEMIYFVALDGQNDTYKTTTSTTTTGRGKVGKTTHKTKTKIIATDTKTDDRQTNRSAKMKTMLSCRWINAEMDE